LSLNDINDVSGQCLLWSDFGIGKGLDVNYYKAFFLLSSLSLSKFENSEDFCVFWKKVDSKVRS
jgi:hypothetical protein